MKFPVFTAISSNLVLGLDFFLVQKLMEYLEWHSRPCSIQSLAENGCISKFKIQISCNYIKRTKAQMCEKYLQKVKVEHSSSWALASNSPGVHSITQYPYF